MQYSPFTQRGIQTDGLLTFNQRLIDQALALVAVHETSRQSHYAGPVGAHLRHVIEHYEALVFPAEHGVVDYDGRARDRELEGNPALASERLSALRARLDGSLALHAPVQVRGQGGLAGEFIFAVPSCIGRELAFLASHTVHHFALLAPHCWQHGIPTPADFGQAPSTVAHARASSATPTSHPTQEFTCPSSLLSA